MNLFEEIEKVKIELPGFKTIARKIKKIKLNFYQVFSLFIYVVVLCLGVIFGNLFPTCGTSSALYSGVCITTQFNFSLMLCIWFVGMILCLFIFAIGHIICLLESINSIVKR